MSRHTILACLLALPLAFLVGCPVVDDDDVSDDDDSATVDDDDVMDDDDSGTDDDDVVDDDDAVDDCIDDALEDNDDEASAAAITPPTNDLVACMDDEDWYTLDLAEGEWTVILTFLDDEGDIDSDLYDSAGDEVASGGSGSDNEEMQVTVPAGGGTYHLNVYLYAEGDDATSGNTYTVTTEEYVAPVCENDDAFEDNETDATAAAITAGNHPGLQVCAFDRDWYSIDLAAGDQITVEILFTNDMGDIDASLMDPNGIDAVNGYSSDDNETMGPYTVEADEGGTWLIDVHLFNDPDEIVGNVYEMNITVGSGGT